MNLSQILGPLGYPASAIGAALATAIVARKRERAQTHNAEASAEREEAEAEATPSRVAIEGLDALARQRQATIDYLVVESQGHAAQIATLTRQLEDQDEQCKATIKLLEEKHKQDREADAMRFKIDLDAMQKRVDQLEGFNFRLQKMLSAGGLKSVEELDR